MSLFTPFTFLAPEAAAAWTPLDFANLYDYWEPNTGVTLSGTDVTAWAGANGNCTLTEYQPAVAYPYYSSSDATFGGQPSILLNYSSVNNDVGLTTTSFSTNASDKTIMMVGYLYNYLPAASSGFNNLINFSPDHDPRAGIFGMASGGDVNKYACYRRDPPTDILTYNSNTFTEGSYQFVRMSYDYSTGTMTYFGSNTSADLDLPIKTQTGASGLDFGDFTNASFNVGCYRGGFFYTPRMAVVEVVFIDGIPTATEMGKYQTWLSNTYGLS